MGLQAKLQAIQAEFAANAPEEIARQMKDATADLKASGILDNILTTGDAIPDVTLADSRGQRVSLKEKLSDGPLVLSFFRGQW